MRRLLLCLSVLISLQINAQDFSNKGKDFYVCFPNHVPNSAANIATLSIFVTSDLASSGTISMPNGAFSATFNIAANGIQEIQIPWNANVHISNAESNTVLNKSIRIQTNPGQPAVVAYAQQWAGARSAATLLLPVNVLGRKYFAASFTQTGSNQSTFLARSQFQIIAVKPNTNVSITPRKNGVLQTPFVINLPNAGDIYQYQSTDALANIQDITGTLIESVASGSGGCLPIAVFSGSSNITFGIVGCNTGNSFDPLFQQLYPAATWGKNFGFIPFSGHPNGNPYRVMASENNTNVFFNGTLVATLNAGEIYPNSYTATPAVIVNPTNITSDKSICVSQFMQRNACSGRGNTQGDPDMVILNPIEQNIKDITIFSSNRQNITEQFINVLLKTVAVPSFRLNNAIPAAATWLPMATLPGYSYLRYQISGTSARLSADSGFNAIAYGLGANESYAYSAGTNVKDLFQQVGITSPLSIETSPSVCTGSPFKFKVSLPYLADSIRWNLSNLPGSPANVLMTYSSPAVPTDADSSTVVNGKTIYWYSLPNFYNFATIGTFPVSITTYTASAEGCGNEQLIDFELGISNPPIAGFSETHNGCIGSLVQFNDQTTSTKPTYKWWWNFGDPASGANNNSILQNPTHTFSGPGTYNVRFASVTTPGCLSDTFTRQVVVNPFPVGSLGANILTCQNTPTAVVFTATVGTAPFTFTYNINNGAPLTAVTTTGNSVSVNVPTGTAGTFAYHLVSVRDAAGTSGCFQNIADTQIVTVNPLPTGSIITSSSTVCQNAASPFITFTGANATNLPYTFTYNINGGPNLTVTTTVGNSVNVPIPTNTAGTFTYNLLSVGDGSSPACSQAQTGSVSVLVKALPTANIAGTINVCLNATAPNITFTGAQGVAPFTFTYNINGGTNQTVTTTVGNSVTVPVPTTLAGTFIYNLVSVSEGSADNCFQLQTGNATVVVNSLPSATVAGATSICLNGASPNVTFTGSGTTAPYTFTYNINGGANQIVTTTVGNSVTVAAPTNVAGTFTYNLVSVQDGTATSCNQIQSGATSIIIQSLPTATLAGTTSVCLNGVSPNVTFTAANGTAPYIFTYNIDGGASQTVTTTVANSVTVAVPTTTAGTFTYNLLSVQEGSTNACLQNQTGNTVVIVNPLPTATIGGSTAVCLNTPSPNITFTGASGTAPYTFTYNINGGANQTVTTTAGNAVTVAAPTNAAGTFTYNLISVTDASSSICSQAQTGNAVVIIHPLPTPGFSFTIPSCETRLISFTDNSVPNVGTLTNWSWNFGDPGSGINNVSSLQNPVHTFSTAGNYTVSLIVTTTNGCSNVLFSRIVTINDRPLAGYIIPEVCLSDTYAQFLDTSSINNGSITAWAWNFGDINSTVSNPNTSTLQNPTHSFTAVGSYIVQLIATSNNGCIDTVTHTLIVNGSFPVSNFTVNNPTSLCANDSIAIVNTSTVFPGVITRVEIYWDNVNFPTVFQTDDVPFAGKVYRHLYPNFQTPLTKTFTIRYRSYSGGVCVNDKIDSITVNASPRVQFTTIPNSCLNIPPFQITQASEIGGVPGTGIFSGPGITASGIFDPSLVGPGTYTIRYLFTSTSGCVDSAFQSITVLRAPVATFTSSLPSCEKQLVNLTQTSSSADGTISTYTWNLADGTPAIINNTGIPVSHTFAAAGTYNVTLLATTNYGCISSLFTLPVVVNPLPVPNFTVPAGVCLPDASVLFTNTSSIADGTQNSFTYNWNFGDPASGAANTSTALNPTHVYVNVGPYNVTLRVTSAVGCIKDSIIPINNINPQPIAAFGLDQPNGVCIGTAATFRDLSNGVNGTLTQWFWDFGEGAGFVSQTSTPSHTYAAAGLFNVSLRVINSFGCSDTTTQLPFRVNPYPTVDLGPDRFVLEGGSLLLQPVVTAIMPQYAWTPVTYLNNPNIEAPTSIPFQDITYTLTVTGRGGCSTSDDVFVKVLLGPKAPNTFSPNGDGINERWVIDYLDTYPNCRVQVFTRNGQKIFESRGYKTPWDGTMNGKPLPVDTYYYILEPGNGRKPQTGYVTIIK